MRSEVSTSCTVLALTDSAMEAESSEEKDETELLVYWQAICLIRWLRCWEPIDAVEQVAVARSP